MSIVSPLAMDDTYLGGRTTRLCCMCSGQSGEDLPAHVDYLIIDKNLRFLQLVLSIQSCFFTHAFVPDNC